MTLSIFNRPFFASLNILALAVSAFSAQETSAQILSKTQDFSNTAVTPSTLEISSTTATNAATAGYYGTNFTQPGPGAYGSADNNASATPNTITTVFATQTFQLNSTGNALKFQLGQQGQFGFDNNNFVTVDISLNGAAPVRALTVNGTTVNNASVSFNIGTGGTSTSSYSAPVTVIESNTNTIGNFTINLPNFTAPTYTTRTTVGVTIAVTASRKSTVLIDNVTISSGSPLPVELTRFDAAAKGTGVGLTWATASEKNSAYFDVQRSATGEAYETIGRVAAQGTSSSLREYDFTDARPLAGLAYYRLRQVDNDGATAYSPVATVRRGAEALAIYPNPTTDAVTLPASLGPVRYRILNGLGQSLSSGQAAGGDRLDLSTLPKGAFFLELTDAAGRRTQRLMRQ